MTSYEAEKIVRLMCAIWRAELSELETLVWADTLGPLNFDRAVGALNTLKTESNFAPSHAAFLAAYDGHKRRYAATYHRPFPALNRPRERVSPEEARRRFDAMRALIRKRAPAEDDEQVAV